MAKILKGSKTDKDKTVNRKNAQLMSEEKGASFTSV